MMQLKPVSEVFPDTEICQLIFKRDDIKVSQRFHLYSLKLNIFNQSRPITDLDAFAEPLEDYFLLYGDDEILGHVEVKRDNNRIIRIFYRKNDDGSINGADPYGGFYNSIVKHIDHNPIVIRTPMTIFNLLWIRDSGKQKWILYDFLTKAEEVFDDFTDILEKADLFKWNLKRISAQQS